MTLSIKRDWVWQKKMELTFLRLFDNPLWKYLLKESPACNGFFGLFTKVKKRSGNSLWYTFSTWFSNKNVPYLILYQWTKFQCHIFFLLKIPNKMCIKFLLRQLMASQTLRFIFNQSLKQWLTGRKKVEDGNTKFWISRERTELFRWNKKHFS